MPEIRTSLFHADFEVLSEVLIALIIAALLVERGLSVIFENRLFIERVLFDIQRYTGPERSDSRSYPTTPITRINIKNRGLQEVIAFSTSLAVCFFWDFDAFSTVMWPMSGRVSFLGEVLTAMVITGGCRGSQKLFREWMGIKSSAQEEVDAFFVDARRAQRIALAAEKVEQNPTKVVPVWEFANTMLLEYYQKNLLQVRSIYRVILGCMVVGFLLIIAATISATFEIIDSDFRPIALWAGIISEFIGATFLFLYRSIMSQALEYTKSLEKMNDVGMALKIIDSIPETASNTEKVNQAKVDISKDLVTKSRI
ncbi:MAG: hypothetical protein IPM46_11155 [Flavobacteriales bacterium]|nr:hypothetical protein [Flavobacteriales bacterium]